MKTKNKPRTSLMILTAMLIGIPWMSAQAQEAAPPGVLATYACNFNEGKDMDDLRSVRDYYVSQAAKAGVSTPEAYVWTRFKGGVPFDHIWFDLYANVAEFATNAEEWRDADMSKVDARFEALETCEANVSNVRPIHIGDDSEPGAGSTFVSSNACNLRHGMGPDDLADLEGHISGVLSGLEEYKGTALFAATPMTDGTNSADVYIFSVSSSPSAWAAGTAAVRGSPRGAALGRHFNGTLDCSTSLWYAEQVVAPAE